MTKNEAQVQFLLQDVAENRKRHPHAPKRTLFGTTEATSAIDNSDSAVIIASFQWPIMMDIGQTLYQVLG